MLRASDATRSIRNLQIRITTARTSFTRAYWEMQLENASIERDFEEVYNEILRLLDTIEAHLSSQHFQ